MEFSQHSEYARSTEHRSTDTPHRSTFRHALKRASKRRILSAALLATAAGAMLGVSSLQAAESHWPGTQRRFAPSIWLDGFKPNMSLSQMNSHWKTWAEPYYADWIDPSRGEKVGMWFPSAGLTAFYVDKNRQPANPKDPNDPNYNWQFVDNALASDAVRRHGATVNIRLDLEGSGMFPSWFEALGYTTLPAGQHKDIINWEKPAAVQALKDFITAFAKRYNGNENIYTIAIPEQGGSSKSTVSAKVEFVRHITQEFDRTMLAVFQNTGISDAIKDIPGVGWGTADAKPFFGSCGASGGSYGDNGKPLCDCQGSGVWGRAQNYTSVAGVPACSGKGAFTVVSGEPNGMNIIGDSGSTPNPWGERLPSSREMLPEADLSPAVYAWYHSYKPRGNKRSSGLGYNGAEDPAGIIPTHVMILSTKTKGAKPADWDRAFSTFGKAGTNAILWPPANFSASTKSEPEPESLLEFEPAPLPEPEPAPLPQSCPVVPAPGQTLFNACYNALGYTKPFTTQEKQDIKACEAACELTEVVPLPEPEPQPIPLPEPEPQPVPETEPEPVESFGTPENFEVTAARSRSVELSWKDVNGEQGYTIQWRRGARGNWRDLKVGADTTRLTHRDLRRRTTYNYRICADRSRRQGGSSDWSSVISIRTR